MKPFLSRIADELIAAHQGELHDVLILMPNKRGELFLKRSLAERLSKPVLAPAMSTIEEFVQAASGLVPQSQIQLVILLFQAYREQLSANEDFDAFVKWGSTLLQDFNEIDRHMVDAEQLYQNLLDAKKIESWGVVFGKETPMVKSFLDFWQNLYPLYTRFRESLMASGKSYQGLAYRKVASTPDLLDRELSNKYKAIYLLGFNALNKAEEIIFQHLMKVHAARVYWDADAFYLNDEQHEAGEFLRNYRRMWFSEKNSEFTWQVNDITALPRKIQVISAPAKQGMAQMAAEILQSLPAEDSEATAVVLADENMLLPLLDAIPDNYEELNVTMGMPLINMPLAQDFLALMRMHELAERNRLTRGSYRYYHRSLMGVLQSGVFYSLAGRKAADELCARITEENLVYLTPAQVLNLFTESGLHDAFWQDLTAEPENVLELVKRLDSVLKRLASVNNDADDFSRQAAFTLHALHMQSVALLEGLNAPVSQRTWLRLYQNFLRENQLDFYGEPLAGLQIMGMLETRTLDFKRIIITSLNEGILPSGKQQNSFIPHDLKLAFRMPTHQEKDAVYAYHFYRLLQRAEEIWLIYDSSNAGIGTREKSRFILQIEQEWSELPNVQFLPAYHYNAVVSGDSLLKVPSYVKDDLVMARLAGMASYGLSASALTELINNPADFYVNRILRVEEADEVSETIGHDVLGNVVHSALEFLYQPFIGKDLSEAKLAALQPAIKNLVEKKLREHYKGNLKEGRNLLISRVAEHMVRSVILADIENLKNGRSKGIINLEQKLSCEIAIPGLDIAVKFIGTADRIEEDESGIFIVDYKTGSVNPDDLKIKSPDQLFVPEKKNKAFQVLYYAWLYSKMHGSQSGMSAGLFATRKPGEGFMKLSMEKSSRITPDILNDFENQLFQLIRDLFNPDLFFAPVVVDLDDDESNEYA